MDAARRAEIASEVVEAVQKKLPDALRPLAVAVPVHYETLPDDTLIDEGFEPDILGLFSGDSHGTSESQDNPSPPQIVLYLDNIWDFAEERLPVFRDEVRLTYLHELGHYFGWDEDEVADRGLE